VNRLSTKVHFIKGDPGQVIPSFATEHRIDVLVIGTIGRSGTSGLIIGNTAEKVLNQLQCSVLALKPPGFVSPIQ
jgi:nucleotide-binding universal stress UspA family protein